MKSGRSQPSVTSRPPSIHSVVSLPGLPRPSPSVSSHKVTSTDVPPHTPAQSSSLPSQSQAPSAIPSPPQTPHSSSTALPPHSPAQSNALAAQSGYSSEQSATKSASATGT